MARDRESSADSIVAPTVAHRRSKLFESIVVTLPVYNEAPSLERSVDQVYAVLASLPYRSTLSIAEDGSTDETPQVISQLSVKYPGLLIQNAPEKLGRGLALRRLWSRLDADAFIFVDADLAIENSGIVAVIDRLARGAEVVTGSRYTPSSRVVRPPLRQFVSMGYNWMVRFVFGGPIQDHQCGLKGFTRRAISEILPLTIEDSWFWDTEALVIAQRLGYAVEEVPVAWRERKNLRTGIRRLFADILLHGAGVIRLKSRVGTISPSGPPVSGVTVGGSSVFRDHGGIHQR